MYNNNNYYIHTESDDSVAAELSEAREVEQLSESAVKFSLQYTYMYSSYKIRLHGNLSSLSIVYNCNDSRNFPRSCTLWI